MVKKSRRLVLPLALLLLLLITSAAVLGYFSDLKTVVYDNGKGRKYQISFYTRHSQQNVTGSENILEGYSAGITSGKKLVSEVSRDDKAPIILAISELDFNSQVLQAFSNCSRGTVHAFTVHNKNVDDQIKMCSAKTDGVDAVYTGVFRQSQTIHLIKVMQDLDYSKVEDYGDIKKLLAKTDLKVYDNDLKKIIASIKPLD